MTWHSISYEHSSHSTIKAREEIPRFGNLAAFSLCLLENLWVLISSQLPLKSRGDDRKQPCRTRCLKEGAQNKVSRGTEATKTQSERRRPLRDAAAPPPTLERSSCWSQSAISEAYLVKLSWWVGPLQSSEVQILHISCRQQILEAAIGIRATGRYVCRFWSRPLISCWEAMLIFSRFSDISVCATRECTHWLYLDIHFGD